MTEFVIYRVEDTVAQSLQCTSKLHRPSKLIVCYAATVILIDAHYVFYTGYNNYIRWFE